MTRAGLLCQIAALHLLVAGGCAPGESGLSPTRAVGAIVGGTPAPDGFLPAVGALVVDLPYNYRLICSGTLVADRLVLCASHCFETLAAGTALGFFTGQSVAVQSPSVELTSVDSVYVHPQYQGGDLPTWLASPHDIALVELASSPGVQPLKLVEPAEASQLVQTGGSATIAGFGRTEASSGTSSGTKHSGATVIGEVGTHEIHLDGTTANVCIGDSGGPALADLDPGPGHDWRVIGVTSRSAADCTGGSIETRVDPYLKWLAGSGTLGEACSAPADCLSALCVPTAEGTFCSRPCSPAAQDCPSGYSCAPIKDTAKGGCVKVSPPPPLKELGESCAHDAECEEGLCASLDEQRFCSRVCDDGAACGPGLVCSATEEGSLCVPEALAPADPGGGGGCSLEPGPEPGPGAGTGAKWPWFLVLLPLLRRSRR